MFFGIDFDGTVSMDMWPAVGDPVPYAIDTLKDLVKNGHNLFLWTVRDGITLEEAERFFQEHEIPLIGLNQNPYQGGNSFKAFAHYYIDDRAIGCPLITDEDGHTYVDWKKIRILLKQIGALP